MMSLQKSGVLVGVALAALVLGACSRTASPPSTGLPQPAQIEPVQTGSVQSTDLPPIGGQSSTSSPMSGSTQIQGASTISGNGGFTGNTSGVFDPSTGNTTSGGFVSLDDIGGPGNTTGGRDLSGALTMERLLGGWTIIAGAEQCRLNLTYTASGATGRYRASTPGCGQETLAQVTSWQLLGNQIQLYDDDDAIIGTLLRSGDRFMGTLAGGQAISLAS